MHYVFDNDQSISDGFFGGAFICHLVLIYSNELCETQALRSLTVMLFPLAAAAELNSGRLT